MDNRYSTSLSIDNYLKSEIVISTTSNIEGTLDTNEYGNILNGNIVKGNQIRACSSIVGSFLLYTNKQYKIIDETFDLDVETSNLQGFILEKEKINYKIKAVQEDILFDGYVVELAGTYDGTTNFSIFKVFLNGVETTNYTSTIDTAFIDFESNTMANIFSNTITIVYYDKTQTITTEELHLWCYLPYKVFSGKLNYYEVGEWVVYENALEIECGTWGDLLTIIPNINGKPKGVIWICNNTEARRIQEITADNVTVDRPFTEAYNGTMWWTTEMRIKTHGDYSISDSPEFYKYNTRFNKMGINKQINKNNTISLSFFQFDSFEVEDKIPVLHRNLASQTLENTRFLIKEYEKNSNIHHIYTNCQLVSTSSINRSMSNNETITITYDNKVGDL